MKKNKKDSFSKKVKVTKLTREDGQSEKLEEKRINVKKIASLNDLINKPLNEVKILLENIEQLKKIDNIFKTNGKTNVNIFIKNNNQNLSFKLKSKDEIYPSVQAPKACMFLPYLPLDQPMPSKPSSIFGKT